MSKTIQTFVNRKFTSRVDRDGRVFSNMVFHRCFFDNCGFSFESDVRRRSVVREVRVVDCTTMSCHLNHTVFEDVVVDNLETYNLLQAFGAVFKHVTLRGKIGRLMLVPEPDLDDATEEQQAAFHRANTEYYRNLDWAIDISEAEFDELDLVGVPTHLIRRDPSRQFVVRRANAEKIRWKPRTEAESYWRDIIDVASWSHPTVPDVVLVVPRCKRRDAGMLAGLRRLRELGIAEPD